MFVIFFFTFKHDGLAKQLAAEKKIVEEKDQLMKVSLTFFFFFFDFFFHGNKEYDELANVYTDIEKDI